jgi:hypothetical protein
MITHHLYPLRPAILVDSTPLALTIHFTNPNKPHPRTRLEIPIWPFPPTLLVGLGCVLMGWDNIKKRTFSKMSNIQLDPIKLNG